MVDQGYHQINWDNPGYPGLVACGPERVGTGAIWLISSSHEKQTAVEPRASRDREFFSAILVLALLPRRQSTLIMAQDSETWILGLATVTVTRTCQ